MQHNTNDNTNVEELKLKILSWASEFANNSIDYIDNSQDSLDTNLERISEDIGLFAFDASPEDIVVVITFLLMVISQIAVTFKLEFKDIEDLIIIPASMNVMNSRYE